MGLMKKLKNVAGSTFDPFGLVTGNDLDITGKGAARDAGNAAANALITGQNQAMGYLGEGYNATNALNQPVADLYKQYLPQLQGMMGPDTQSQGYMGQLAGMSAPQLQSNVNFDLENDPIYAQQRDQMMRQLNRRMAAGGQYASSDADNAMIRNLLPFMQDSYGRGLDTLNRGNQNALTSYGINADRYNTLYGMSNQQNQQQYDRAGNMINLRLAGINAMSGNADAYGRNRANIATNTANAMADNKYALGQLETTMSPLNTLASIGSTAAKFYSGGKAAGGA